MWHLLWTERRSTRTAANVVGLWQAAASWGWRRWPAWRPAAASSHDEQAEAKRSAGGAPWSASSSRSCGPSTTRSISPASWTPSSRLDFLQGVRVHQAFRRGHRPRGEEGRTAGRNLRSRTGRRAPAEVAQVELDKRRSTGPAVGRWPRATSRWPIAQLAEAKANVGQVSGRGRPLGLRGETP